MRASWDTGGYMTEDEILKVYLSDSQRFADLMNGLNFAGKQVVHPEDVQEQDGQEVFFRVGFWEKTLGRISGRRACQYV